MLKKLLLHSLALLLLSAITGSVIALFLWLLDTVTHFRFQHPWLLYLLPLGGILVYYLYQLWGKNSEKGNNLIIEEIHAPGGGVPRRMAPLVLAGTIITHLFGGSAGREGTAVQIGGSTASLVSQWFSNHVINKQVLLMAGIAAGFGAVFGTPFAGTIFAVEVLALGSFTFSPLIPCLVAAFLADFVCSLYHIHHTHYHISSIVTRINGWLIFKVAGAGILFGFTAFLFAELTHGFKYLFQRIPVKWLIPAVGGVMIIALTWLLQTDDYLGLGVQKPPKVTGISIVGAFGPAHAPWLSWWWKLLFTAITLSCGMKGGEVTPLFFIGATLGSVLGSLLGVPVDLMAALGFIAVFAGATNTPIACTIMGIELFGPYYTFYFAIACGAAYLSSGHISIYSSQQIQHPKLFNRRRHGHETSMAAGFQRRRQFTAKYISTLKQLLR
ncbi:H+/Cl-antiporter ClcA [Filimonas lacunae]|uniref:H+/Cl-antiporter ClcA n=1 Tax=Filimonas lacunae TaxID=477680 RepID=A0A173MCL6_9BACT|nr:voltage-gated chloride channel family protein [Filimonas lacunae]BAV05260.1 chloride channel protein [Filimonas lacunae]SIT22341.1 H+/Cl-antiporter ClcA [Filimonas lacunae]